MKSKALFFLPLPVFLLACSTPGPEIGSAPSPEQFEAYRSKAVDPRMMGLTVYRSKTGPSFSGSNRIYPGYREAYPLLPAGKAGLPVIRFDARWLDGLTALIDTRSKYSWTDLYTGGQLEFVSLGKRPYEVRPGHVAEALVGTAGYKNTLRLNALRIEDAILFLRPEFRSLGALGRGLEPPLPHLVLGLDILKKLNYLTIDYAAHTVVLSSKGGYKPSPMHLLSRVPMRASSQGLLVQGRPGSQRGYILIDTGGDYRVACPPEQAIGDEIQVGELKIRVPYGASGDRNGSMAPAYPAIGHRVLKDYKVTFDFKNRLAYFEQSIAE